MNEDLIIGIGANLSSYNSALKSAEQSFKTFSQTFSSKNQPKLVLKLDNYLEDMEKAKKEFKHTRDLVEQRAIKLGLDTTKIKGELDSLARTIEKSNADLIKDHLTAWDNAYAEKARREIEATKTLRAKIDAINKKNGLGIQAFKKQIDDESTLAKQGLATRLAEFRKNKAEELRIAKDTAEAQYRVDKDRLERQIKIAQLVAKTKKRIAKEIADKEIAEQNRVRTIQQQAWILQQQQAVAQGRASSIVGPRLGRNTPTSDEISRVDRYGQAMLSLSHAFKAVLLYGTVYRVYGEIVQGMKDAGTEMIRFNQSLYDNMAVLNATKQQAEILSKTSTALSQKYGGAVEDIAQAMLTLGRAGFEVDKGVYPLQQATKILAELSMITGDSMSDGAAGISTLVSVYPKLINQLDLLGNQMAIVANATRLGLKDFTTISNYALTTAASIGIESEAYLALAGAMSKVGLNASTIGTSIRRLKKFTDSTAESMQTFFRYLGISQKDFTLLLQDSSTSTATLITLTRHLAKIRDTSSEKYMNMTKNLNIQEKATIDTLALIGKADYMTKMILDIGRATKESKELEKQALLMSQGLKKAFERISNILSQTFNGLGDAISGILFDSSSTEAFTESINRTAQVIVSLIKEIPVLGAAWLLYANRVSIVNSVTSLSTLRFNAMSISLTSVGTAIKSVFTSFGGILSLLTIGMTVWNVVSTNSIRIQEDLNELMKKSKEELEDYSEAQLAVANRTSKNAIMATQASKDRVEKELELAKKMKDYDGESNWFGLVNRTEQVENLTLKLENLTSELERQKKLAGELASIQSNFSDNTLSYNMKAKDLANAKEIQLLAEATNDAVTKELLSYAKINATLSATTIEMSKQGAIKDNEAKTIKATLAYTNAQYSLKKEQLKISDNLVKSEIKLLEARNKYNIYLDGTKKYKLELASMIDKEVKLEAERAIGHDAIHKKIVEQGNAYKTSFEYQIQITEQNRILTEQEKLKLDKLKLINEEEVRQESLLRQTIEAAFNLATQFATMASQVASVTRELDIMLGKMSQGEAGIANSLDTKKIADLAVKSAEVSLEQAKIAQDTANIQKEAVAIEKAKLDVQAKSSALAQAQTQQQIAGIRVNMASVSYANEQTKAYFDQNKLLIESDSLKGSILSKDDRAIQKLKNTQKLLKIEIEEARANYAISSSEENRNAVIRAQNKLLEANRAEQEKILDISERKEGKGAAEERARLKLVSDDVAMQKLIYDLEQAKLETYYAQQGTLFTTVELDARNVEQAKKQLEFEKLTLIEMEKAGKLDLDKATIAKKIIAQEIAIEKAKKKVHKLELKNMTDLQNAMKSSFEGALSAIASGDGAAAITSLSGIFEKSFTDATDGISTALTGMFTTSMSLAEGLDNMLKALMANPWMLAIAIIMKALQSGLFSTVVSQQEIDASKGQLEFSDSSLEDLKTSFESAQYPLLKVTSTMSNYIRNMDKNFYSIAKAFSTSATTGGVDLTGVNFIDSFDSGFLGFSTKSIELIGTGLKFAVQTFGEMMDSTTLSVQSYTTELVKKSYGWGLIKSEEIKETYKNLPQPIIDDMAKNFAYGFETIMTAGVSLGLDSVNLEKTLEAVNIDIGKLDFTGLSPEEVNTRLSEAFSQGFSGAIEQIPALTSLVERYSKVGEDALGVLGRLAMEFEQASFSFDLIGKTFTDNVKTGYTETTQTINEVTGSWFTTVIGSIITVTKKWIDTTYTAQKKMLDIVDASGGLDAFNDNMSAFMTGFYTESEQIAMQTKALETQFATLASSNSQLIAGLPTTNEEFRTLVENFEVLNEADAETYASLLSLAGAFAEVNPLIDEQSTLIQDMIKNVSDAWLGNLSYLNLQQKAEYASGYMSILASANGGVNTVDGTLAALQTKFNTASTREDTIVAFDRYIQSIKDEAPKATMDDSVAQQIEMNSKMETLISRIESLEDSIIEVRA
jgi:hypothetical protein